jgi:hypothetical protein
MAGQTQVRHECDELQVQGQVPARPNSTVLNDSIPLFFIGRNQKGFWVARESAGRCGGLFVFRRSAARFASRNGLAGGGATMLVEHSIELDLPNQGNRLAEPIARTIDIVKRHAPVVATLIGIAIAEWRKLVSRIAQALNAHYRNREAIENDLYRNREAIENDLFRGEYKLVSKNDDDLPILR